MSSLRVRAEGQGQRDKQGQITQGFTAFSALAGLSPEGNREFLEQFGKSLPSAGRERQTEQCHDSSCMSTLKD